MTSENSDILPSNEIISNIAPKNPDQTATLDTLIKSLESLRSCQTTLVCPEESEIRQNMLQILTALHLFWQELLDVQQSQLRIRPMMDSPVSSMTALDQKTALEALGQLDDMTWKLFGTFSDTNDTDQNYSVYTLYLANVNMLQERHQQIDTWLLQESLENPFFLISQLYTIQLLEWENAILFDVVISSLIDLLGVARTQLFEEHKPSLNTTAKQCPGTSSVSPLTPLDISPDAPIKSGSLDANGSKSRPCSLGKGVIIALIFTGSAAGGLIAVLFLGAFTLRELGYLPPCLKQYCAKPASQQTASGSDGASIISRNRLCLPEIHLFQ